MVAAEGEQEAYKYWSGQFHVVVSVVCGGADLFSAAIVQASAWQQVRQ
jgi:hypothetical protein